MRQILLALLLIALPSMTALAATEDIKDDLKKIGRDVKELGHKIQKEVHKEASQVGQKVKQSVGETKQTWSERLSGAINEFGLGLKNAWSRLRGETPPGRKPDDFN